ncbi:MAG TPA: tRNA guanosine(34) transglycosylase Tgt [Candidatus Paceibacterota bacterium]|nr:tRNA guanosine(34) transglycosylase Tgt [Candidatus Paceibacterota bacterium]
MKFSIEKKLSGKLGRTGTLETPHGVIQTPAFVTVGTKATVKALTPEQVKDLGAQVVLANTYHLYLEPGDEIVRDAGGLHRYMNWQGPTMTDSGGFQVFSLGAAFGEGGISKITKGEIVENKKTEENDLSTGKLAKITENGVEFRSHIDGSKHFFTPEKSIEIQQNIGADMIFAFDECTSPVASHEYQKEAMARTHRWAERSLAQHRSVKNSQGLFGIVQGGRFEDLRKESAKFISGLDFEGFGIGGSFEKEDMYTAVGWVNAILPEEKPRHLLGIGEPIDFFGGVENGVDLFDCVAPTRMARNGTLHTKDGRMNIVAGKYRRDFSPIEEDCGCYTCQNYTRAYLCHLFRGKEMLAATLASIHNLYFTVHLVQNIRESILDDTFFEYKENFLGRYYQGK